MWLRLVKGMDCTIYCFSINIPKCPWAVFTRIARMQIRPSNNTFNLLEQKKKEEDNSSNYSTEGDKGSFIFKLGSQKCDVKMRVMRNDMSQYL